MAALADRLGVFRVRCRDGAVAIRFSILREFRDRIPRIVQTTGADEHPFRTETSWRPAAF